MDEYKLPPIPLPDDYQIPTSNELDWLRVEVIILIVIYCVTIGFVLHNIVRYLWLQRKFRMFQITIFYFLALSVLAFRIWQYIGTLKLYKSMQEFLAYSVFEILRRDYYNEVEMIRRIGDC